jgi:lipopolysaccharide export system protein LptA
LKKTQKYLSIIANKTSFLFAIISFAWFSGFSQNSDTNKIYILPGAHYLTNFGDEIDNVKLVGNARFMHDSVFMRCDTAYIFNKTKSVIAIGNVKVNQGDSLFLYGDTLNYFGNSKMAYVHGNVKLIENDLTLTSDSVIYNMNTNVASYETYGKVISKKNDNTLTSIKGYYYSNTKVLSFKDSVTLKNPDYTMKSDTLNYHEETEIAYFLGNTTIDGDDNFIFCKNGWYDTQNDIAQFNEEAYMISDNHKLEGDSLYYDQKIGFGKAIGNVTITDTANKLIVKGELAKHYDKENTSLVTGTPMVQKWFNNDTLHLTADTIRVYNDSANEKNTLFAHYGVRFYKSDIQGDCDSMVYFQNDSMLRMYNNPIIWSEKSQLSGDTVYVQIANNKIKEINLLNNSFIIEEIKDIIVNLKKDTLYINDSITGTIDTVVQDVSEKRSTNQFNQIKGKTIKGVFRTDTIRKVYVNGNGQSIYYTGDEGKPKEGMNKIVCSNIIMTFKDNKVNDILFLKKPEGSLYPIQDISEEDKKLDGFHWEIEKRPKHKDDLIIKSKHTNTDENKVDGLRLNKDK